jgi:replicative DNA helicase
MADPITPLELSERALVGGLLWQPGRVTWIARSLDPEHFRTPANGAAFRHVRDMVAEVIRAQDDETRANQAWVMYYAQLDVGRRHARLIPESLEVFRASRQEITTEQLDAARERTGLGADLQAHTVEVPATVADADLAAAAADALLAQPDFDFEAEVIGDDIVVGGIVYSADEYTYDREGDVRPLTADERDVRNAQQAQEAAEDEARLYTVPGVTPQTVLARIMASTELGDQSLTAPYLHTLMHTAPVPHGRQLESYALFVAEAAVRRDVERGGMRVAQATEANPELVALIAAVDTAVDQIDALQQRWRAVTGDRTLTGVLDAGGGPITVPRVDPDSITVGLDLFAPAPDERTLAAAQDSVLAHLLVEPAALARLVDRLLPEDFADPELGNAYRAAIEVHTAARTGGPLVDVVTVAWEQQRHVAQHGPGAAPERLLALRDSTVLGDLGYVADVVMRGALSRLTAQAATAVQQAAQHPGLQPGDVLHTARMAYTAVRATADRMTGQASTASRMSGFAALADPVPAAPAPPAAAGRTTAQVLDLRTRAAAFRATVSATAGTDTRTTDQVADLASRLRGDMAADVGRVTPGWPTNDAADRLSDPGPDL